MKHGTCLFKIGGSILEDYENLNATISQLSQLFEEKLVQKIIIIPGGGGKYGTIELPTDDPIIPMSLGPKNSQTSLLDY